MLEWSQWLVGATAADQEKTSEGVSRQTRKLGIFYGLKFPTCCYKSQFKKLHVNKVTCHLMVLDLSLGDITCW